MIFLSTSLFFSIFASVVIFQINTAVLAETRKTALVQALVETQVEEIGAFHYFDYIPHGDPYFSEYHYMNEHSTVNTLLSLQILGGLDNINVDNAARYLATKQHPQSGGYVVGFGYDGTILGFDLCTTCRVVLALRLTGHLNRLNRTLLIDFVLERYESSTGAFHELVTQVYGRNYSLCSFLMLFPGNPRPAYAVPNIISTFFGVYILAELGDLAKINVTRTLEWITHSQADNGMFKPFPNATYEPFPDWLGLNTNPFPVDKNGTGIPYTYAAVGALNALKSLDTLSQEDRVKIRDYIISCREGEAMFRIHKDWIYATELFNTEYSLEILRNIGMLDEATDVMSEVESFLIQQQSLDFENSWPVPQPSNQYAWYRGNPDRIHFIIRILNITNGIFLLDQRTPRAYTTQINLLTLSSLVFITAIVLSAACEHVLERYQKR